MIAVFDILKLRRSLCLILLIAGIFLAFPTQRAHAMDPVTIAILAPVALAVAQKAKPYIIKGLKNSKYMLARMFRDFIDMFRFPLGLFQCTFGAPFGLLGSGVRNLVFGAVAPFKFCFHLILLPVSCFGVGGGK